MKKKFILIKESVYCYPGIWATHYSVATEMPKDLPGWMRSATKVFEADTVRGLDQYFEWMQAK